ncbi:MAG: GTP 3',8-cyclase MoaA, partial [Phycisphaerales bacterium]
MSLLAPTPEAIPLPQWTRSDANTGSAAAPPRAPDSAHRRGVLLDSHGRTIRDLRLSLTDRCNFRCVYCMEPDVRFAPSSALLRAEEFIRLGR